MIRQLNCGIYKTAIRFQRFLIILRSIKQSCMNHLSSAPALIQLFEVSFALQYPLQCCSFFSQFFPLVWDSRNVQSVRVFNGHTNTVSSLHQYDANHFISCSLAEIRIWDLNSGLCQQVITCPDKVTSLCLIDRRMMRKR